MPEMHLNLDELLDLIRDHWPQHYRRGRILHVHRNAVQLQNGAIVHLRVMVQQISEADRHHLLDNTGDDCVSLL